MSLIAILAPALMAQAGIATPDEARTTVHADVGYQELADGRASAAIVKLENSEDVARSDPAALINLGNAYAQIGRTDKAVAAYQAAIDSKKRYELELADGRWMDSRRAARSAMQALLAGTAQASRN